jgi:hypothetical protein
MTRVTHELTDKQCGHFYKKWGIDTRKYPPTRDQLFALIRDVFKAGSQADCMRINFDKK